MRKGGRKEEANGFSSSDSCAEGEDKLKFVSRRHGKYRQGGGAGIIFVSSFRFPRSILIPKIKRILKRILKQLPVPLCRTMDRRRVYTSVF